MPQPLAGVAPRSTRSAPRRRPGRSVRRPGRRLGRRRDPRAPAAHCVWRSDVADRRRDVAALPDGDREHLRSTITCRSRPAGRASCSSMLRSTRSSSVTHSAGRSSATQANTRAEARPRSPRRAASRCRAAITARPSTTPAVIRPDHAREPAAGRLEPLDDGVLGRVGWSVIAVARFGLWRIASGQPYAGSVTSPPPPLLGLVGSTTSPARRPRCGGSCTACRASTRSAPRRGPPGSAPGRSRPPPRRTPSTWRSGWST